MLAPEPPQKRAVVAVRVDAEQAAAELLFRSRSQPGLGQQFLRFISYENWSNSVSGGTSGASREMLNPSGFTTGITMLRVAFTRRVVRAACRSW